jgi:tetratricopeptide (TPR) repeat protein
VRRLVLFWLFLFLLAPIGVGFSDYGDLIRSGDSLFNSYEYEKSIELYNESIAIDSSLAAAYWKLAAGLNLYAELQPRAKQVELFEKAAEAAEKAIRIDSLAPEAHFQFARALGKIALFKGIFKSVALAKRVKKEAEAALALKPDHDGALHILGRWHREVASKPKIFRLPLGLGEADKKKGLPLLAKAIELESGNVHHRLEYAISLLDLGFKEQAGEQLEICLKLQPAGPLDKKYQEQAKEYLAKLK